MMTHCRSAPPIVKSANQAGFLPKGLPPSVEGKPSVSRRQAIAPLPRSGKLRSLSSEVSRSSPSVFIPAALSAFRILVAIDKISRPSSLRDPLEAGCHRISGKASNARIGLVRTGHFGLSRS
jgi:hypothetical protein